MSDFPGGRWRARPVSHASDMTTSLEELNGLLCPAAVGTEHVGNTNGAPVQHRDRSKADISDRCASICDWACFHLGGGLCPPLPWLPYALERPRMLRIAEEPSIESLVLKLRMGFVTVCEFPAGHGLALYSVYCRRAGSTPSRRDPSTNRNCGHQSRARPPRVSATARFA
jgi:hypothetical protein